MAADQDVVFSGIDGTTGEPATPPLSFAQVGALARGEILDANDLAHLKSKAKAASSGTLGAIEDVNTEDLAEAGWAVIFASDADPAIREALAPLLDVRRSQAGAVRLGRYRELSGLDGHRPGERHREFLVRHGMAPGSPADPDVLPYYLLLVGGPDAISFDFQYGLDVTYAVGRLAFRTAQEYARYAEAAATAESQARSNLEIAFFGPRNDDDRATALSVEHLLDPLAGRLSETLAPSWTVNRVIGPGRATKQGLRELLGGDPSPALLMAAGHGLAFPSGNPLQVAAQGGLLCQEWPGPSAWKAAIPPEFYLVGDDLLPAAGPAGMIALLFVCFGAGTPQFDDYVQIAGQRRPLAPAPFVSGLGQRMLAHPKGPALAVVGHVERAMSYSFVWPRAGEQLGAFASALRAIAGGRRLGAALEFLNNRYAALATQLDEERERLRYDDTVDPVELAGLWTARNDARNYVILGDPAVRIDPGATP
jgi:hypothetical protein